MIDPQNVALLLEDEPLIAMDMELVLETAGFAVTSVHSCADTQEWLRMNRPDVAIVDIKLRDGRCDQIVAQLRDRNIPYVVHSGDTPSHHPDTLFALGAWITKPASSEDLVAALRGVMAGGAP